MEAITRPLWVEVPCLSAVTMTLSGAFKSRIPKSRESSKARRAEYADWKTYFIGRALPQDHLQEMFSRHPAPQSPTGQTREVHSPPRHDLQTIHLDPRRPRRADFLPITMQTRKHWHND